MKGNYKVVTTLSPHGPLQTEDVSADYFEYNVDEDAYEFWDDNGSQDDTCVFSIQKHIVAYIRKTH